MLRKRLVALHHAGEDGTIRFLRLSATFVEARWRNERFPRQRQEVQAMLRLAGERAD